MPDYRIGFGPYDDGYYDLGPEDVGIFIPNDTPGELYPWLLLCYFRKEHARGIFQELQRTLVETPDAFNVPDPPEANANPFASPTPAPIFTFDEGHAIPSPFDEPGPAIQIDLTDVEPF